MNEIKFEIEPTHPPKGWKWGYVAIAIFLLWVLIGIIY